MGPLGPSKTDDRSLQRNPSLLRARHPRPAPRSPTPIPNPTPLTWRRRHHPPSGEMPAGPRRYIHGACEWRALRCCVADVPELERRHPAGRGPRTKASPSADRHLTSDVSRPRPWRNCRLGAGATSMGGSIGPPHAHPGCRLRGAGGWYRDSDHPRCPDRVPEPDPAPRLPLPAARARHQRPAANIEHRESRDHITVRENA